jgi:heat shock protein HspQ
VDSLSTSLYDAVQNTSVQACEMLTTSAKFAVGQVVRHRVHPFRGVVFDVDPTFSNTDEWWESIPEENRPRKDQPFYHLLAENETSYYVAYVSEQNLVRDDSGDPVDHPEVSEMFGTLREGRYDLDGHLH